jgi:hypothetical protein
MALPTVTLDIAVWVFPAMFAILLYLFRDIAVTPLAASVVSSPASTVPLAFLSFQSFRRLNCESAEFITPSPFESYDLSCANPEISALPNNSEILSILPFEFLSITRKASSPLAFVQPVFSFVPSPLRSNRALETCHLMSAQ